MVSIIKTYIWSYKLFNHLHHHQRSKFISLSLIFRKFSFSLIDSCGWSELPEYSFLAAGGVSQSQVHPSLRSSLRINNFPSIKPEWTALFSSLFCTLPEFLWELHYTSRLRLLCPCPRHRPLESQSKYESH